MKLKHIGLILAITLISVVVTKAEKLSNNQEVKVAPVVEDVVPTSVLKTETDKAKRQDIVPLLNDTDQSDSGGLNLSFQFKNQHDSTEFSVIEHYIKRVMPVKKNVDSKKFDLIEIL